VEQILLDRQTVTQLVEKFPTFFGTQSSLLSSKESVTGPYFEPDASNPHFLTLFPKVPF